MGIFEKLASPARRVKFYTTALARELVPGLVWQKRKHQLFAEIDRNGLDEFTRSRVNYYNKLSKDTNLGDAPSLREIPRNKSYYYYDLRKDARAFDLDLRVHTLFGDINYVPPIPSVLKSRPVGNDNANSVLLKLNRLRHFCFYHDPIPFEKKRPHAVWRGFVHNDARRKLILLHGARKDHNIGHTGGRLSEGPRKGRLDHHEQMSYRYILSVEGNDVATNTKWIMGSNSVCLMPDPSFETWFMEGLLKPYIHYVPVAKDFSDLDQQIAWCEDNPNEARQIVANANAYVKTFADSSRESLIAMLVLQKYFERTGQVQPAPFSKDVFD